MSLKRWKKLRCFRKSSARFEPECVSIQTLVAQRHQTLDSVGAYKPRDNAEAALIFGPGFKPVAK